MVKRIMFYSRVVDTQGEDQILFTGGPQGVIFTVSEQSGLSIKITPSAGGTIPTSGVLTGLGLAFGDSLVVNGIGHIVVSMWGELQEYYRVINTDQLEVIVGSPVTVGTIGTIGTYTTTGNQDLWLPAGIYTDNTYSITNNTVSWY